MQYGLNWKRESTNSLIEKAILDADEKGGQSAQFRTAESGMIIMFDLHIYRCCKCFL
jgi:hypothetical protein